jgi:hypothetical protein
VENLILFMMLFVCNTNTRLTVLGDQCVQVVERYRATPVLGEGAGASRSSKLVCIRGGILVGEECIVVRYVARNN